MSQEHINQKELRVVVLGFRDSGKTSVINTLLSQTGSEFERKKDSCVKVEGEICGRKLICIDTPGWWRTYPLKDTPEFIKHKLVLSVSECPPGPHAFLLVVDTDASFTEKIRRSVEEHLGLFGEKVWEHTVVVFTRGEYLSDNSIEEHIDSQGESLKWLVEKCGNRYMYINNREGNEAIQLLNQIDSILNITSRKHFELEENKLREVEGRRSTHRERAKIRHQEVADQRETLRKYGDIPSLTNLKILLLGWLFSGKTSAKNTILAQEEDAKRIYNRTYRSEIYSGEVAKRHVTVVDTPGWWKYFPAKCTPEWVKMELQRGITLHFQGPHTILLVVPADTAFQEEQRKTTEDNMKMFGEQVWRYVIVLFTSGDWLGETTIEEHIESEGAPLQWLVEKCGNRYHVLTWDDKEDEVIELFLKIEEMMAGNCSFSQETKAQKTVDEEITKKQVKLPNEMIHLLDQKWQMLDTEEEILSDIHKERKHGSMDAPDAEFSDNNTASEDALEDLRSGIVVCPPEPTFFIQNSGPNSPTGHVSEEMPSENQPGQMEKMPEIFEREWGRREMTLTQKCQRLLLKMRESGSEADVHELNQSYKKVLWWMQTESSGIVSDLQESDLDREDTNVMG